MATGNTSILIDFSSEEKKKAAEQMEQKKKKTREIALQELNEAIASNRRPVRNVAVDMSEQKPQPLKDDRHADASNIYDEAQKVQERLDASRAALAKQQGADEVKVPTKAQPAAPQEAYKGPTVVAYDLGGRKAMSLPVPAYQCQGSGDVTVDIEVNPQGYVVATSIKTSASTNNTCLHEAAMRFAKSSRFAVKGDAPTRQKGYIVYRFIAQ